MDLDVISTIDALARSGLPLNKIAKSTGLRPQYIQYAVWRYGLAEPHPPVSLQPSPRKRPSRQVARVPVEKIEEIRKLLHGKQYLTVREIAAAVGMTRSQASGIIWRWGLNDLSDRPEKFVATFGNRSCRKREAALNRTRKSR